MERGEVEAVAIAASIVRARASSVSAMVVFSVRGATVGASRLARLVLCVGLCDRCPPHLSVRCVLSHDTLRADKPMWKCERRVEVHAVQIPTWDPSVTHADTGTAPPFFANLVFMAR